MLSLTYAGFATVGPKGQLNVRTAACTRAYSEIAYRLSMYSETEIYSVLEADNAGNLAVWAPRNPTLKTISVWIVDGQTLKNYLESNAATYQAIVDATVANNLTAQHALGATDGSITGALAMGLAPAGHFDANTTPITSPGYVSLKNAAYRAAHDVNNHLARAVNAPKDALCVGVGSPLFSMDQLSMASRSVRQRFGDWPNNLRAFSSIDAVLTIVVVRSED